MYFFAFYDPFIFKLVMMVTSSLIKFNITRLQLYDNTIIRAFHIFCDFIKNNNRIM